MYSHVLGDKGGSIFFRVKNYFRRSFYVQIGVLHPILRKIVQFLCKIEWIEFVCIKFVFVLVQTDLIQFENSNCTRSIWTKTNTNLLHTKWIHSISCNIGHIIQIVVHQFVRKMIAKKIPVCKKRSPFILRYAGICRISTKEKKLIPYKPYVCKKHVESILGTRESMSKKVINLNNTIPHSQCLVDPFPGQGSQRLCWLG